jgi:hypothetical protein
MKRKLAPHMQASRASRMTLARRIQSPLFGCSLPDGSRELALIPAHRTLAQASIGVPCLMTNDGGTRL